MYKRKIEKFWTQKEHLIDKDGMLMNLERLVIPRRLMTKAAERLHEGYQCVEKSIGRALEIVWWPVMRGDLSEQVKKCNECTQNRRIRHQPMRNSELPESPWEGIRTYLFEYRGEITCWPSTIIQDG